MTPSPDFGPLDVSEFTLGAMLRTGIALRRAVRDCRTLEAAAQAIVRYFYDHCIDLDSGARTCVLARFYATQRYDSLEPDLQRYVAETSPMPATPPDDMRCLALLGTAGDEPAWNSRRLSRSHRAIPQPSAEIVRAAPMIAGLLEDLGIDLEAVIAGTTPRPSVSEPRTYDVFHVEQALGSVVIPAQEEFVIPYAVRSVVGFGGQLRSGELFAVVLFSRAPIPAASASRFRTIALDIRSALFTLGESSVWEE
jgi:hypothetical protein